jgi:adenosylcobinamide amidohydrolase
MSLFDVACRRPWLIATFREPQRMASWALNRPGIVEARRVAWLEVENSELAGAGDIAAWFVSRLANASLTDAVGLITARNVGSHLRSLVRIENVVAECLITLGLNNGERAGRRVFSHLHPLNAGTINLLCAVSVPLTGAALLEAASVATQARTVALMETGYRRPGREEIITGTGTDCVVVSAPALANAASFAGMHTALGEAVGACVLEATMRAAADWMREHNARPYDQAQRGGADAGP